MRRAVAGVLYGTLAAAALACATVAPPPGSPSDCDEQVYGACIVYDTARSPRFTQSEFEGMFRAAAAYWGTEPEALAGYTVIVKNREGFTLASGDAVWGVTWMDVRLLEFAVPNGGCPGHIFTHEWGHGGAGILGHDDKRFDDAAIRGGLSCRT